MNERSRAPITTLEEREQSRSKALLVVRGFFVIMLVTVVMLAILRGGAGDPNDDTQRFFVQYWWAPLLVALLLGASAILFDALTPHKKLSHMTGALFGLIAGLLATVAISWIMELLFEAHDIPTKGDEVATRILIAIKAAFGITLCYLGFSVVYSTQDEFRLVIPYVEFSKQLRGTRPLVLDTSALIDGRILDIARTGFLLAPLVIPHFVIEELQALADSADKLKRNRGRRGLDIVRRLQNNPEVDLSVVSPARSSLGVDQMLIDAAQEYRAHLVTTDFNLNKVAAIHDVRVLNVNDLAGALRPTAVPGDRLQIQVVKRGENRAQGVGYLEDGTMVVVENASDLIGKRLDCIVTSSIQTSAGRMIFGEWDGSEPQDGEEPSGDERADGSDGVVGNLTEPTISQVEEPVMRGSDPGSESTGGPVRSESRERPVRPSGRNPRRG